MWALAPAGPLAVVAAVMGWWWWAAPAAVVAAAHLRWCLAALRVDPVPDWVAVAPTFTLFAANVLYVNPEPEAMAAAVLAVDADVVVLNETTPALREQLAAAGSRDRYPWRLSTAGRPFDETLWSRLPTTDGRIEVLGGQWVPAVTVDVGGVAVRVFAVHAKAPKRSGERQVWKRQLAAFGDEAAAMAGGAVPGVWAGDFNAAPWHGPFRALLDRGLRSVHDAVGQGLSRSWTPRSAPWSWLGPLMRLDHVLVDDRVVPLSVVDVDVPGSDHRGVLVTLAVRPSLGA